MVKKKQAEQDVDEKKNSNESTDNKNDNLKKETEEQPVSAETEGNNEAEGLKDGTSSARQEPDSAGVAKEATIEKLAEMQDKYLRLSAEFDNYRKRTVREKIELSKYAAENLILKLLPVMDDFERALTHMDNATDCVSMKEGISLIYNKFTDFLKQNGIKEIEAGDCVFNVDLHDAVAKTQVEDEDRKGRIVDVIQKGYYLDDKVIRHSKVVIGE